MTSEYESHPACVNTSKTMRIVRIPNGMICLTESAFCFGQYAERWSLKLQVMEDGEWCNVPMVWVDTTPK